jgi:type IV pilus assembly protein PilA
VTIFGNGDRNRDRFHLRETTRELGVQARRGGSQRLARNLLERGTERLLKRIHTEHGFTLAELMIVVVIMAVLATLAVYGVRGYIRISRTSEVTAVVQSTKGAQEAYREDAFSYLDVSTTFDDGDLYPPGAPDGTTKFAWGRLDGKGSRWAALGVQTSGPVMFGYACVAGAAGVTPIAPDDSGTTFNWAGTAATEPWYVVYAAGDQDGDDVKSVFVASSFTNDLYVYQRME